MKTIVTTKLIILWFCHLTGFIKIFLEKYPDFVSVSTKRECIPDKRVLIVKLGEYLRVNRLKFSYTEQSSAARIIHLHYDPVVAGGAQEEDEFADLLKWLTLPIRASSIFSEGIPVNEQTPSTGEFVEKQNLRSGNISRRAGTGVR